MTSKAAQTFLRSSAESVQVIYFSESRIRSFLSKNQMQATGITIKIEEKTASGVTFEFE